MEQREQRAVEAAAVAAAEAMEEERRETGVAIQTDPVIRGYYREIGTQTDIDQSYLVGLEEARSKLAYEYAALSNYTASLQQQIMVTNEELSTLRLKNDKFSVEIEALHKKVTALETENGEIFERTLSHKTIKDDDTITKFYTGLPSYATFKMLADEVGQHLNRSKKYKLSVEDEFLMFLVKLRLNLLNEDIAFRFGVDASTVSNKFHKWLNLCYTHLGGLVMWPDSGYMQLPEAFQNDKFKKTKVIIDCFEVFIERPSRLNARAKTYSRYKSHNTAKVLIGISPSGAVTFLSKAWGGRASDRKITLDSGLIDKLNPNDVCLADRGFNMEADFAINGVKLMVPAYTRGKKQLPGEDVDESRILASVRIHVERVINRCRDYRILKGPLPISMVKRKKDTQLSTLDKIVTVCGALTNMSPPVLN